MQHGSHPTKRRLMECNTAITKPNASWKLCTMEFTKPYAGFKKRTEVTNPSAGYQIYIMEIARACAGYWIYSMEIAIPNASDSTSTWRSHNQTHAIKYAIQKSPMQKQAIKYVSWKSPKPMQHCNPQDKRRRINTHAGSSQNKYKLFSMQYGNHKPSVGYYICSMVMTKRNASNCYAPWKPQKPAQAIKYATRKSPSPARAIKYVSWNSPDPAQAIKYAAKPSGKYTCYQNL